MNIMTEIVHYFGLICLISSLLLRVLPSAEEIGWKPYAIILGMIRRASLNLPGERIAGGQDASPAK